MKKTEKAIEIAKILDDLYPMPEIPLQHRDPYTLLVAVVLSAQCTDARVNEITPRLFEVASTPEQMVRLDVREIASIIHTCGLAPTKSKSIWGLSKKLIDDHDGRVPADMAALEQLPGVGHKTASVVMCQAFGKPAFPVDTHIHRLAGRWGLSTGKSVVETERDLKRLFPRDRWHALHLQIIYFGRQYCPARNHDLTQCPICSWAASKKRIEAERQKTSRKKSR